MKVIKRLLSVMLCVGIIVTSIPAIVYAKSSHTGEEVPSVYNKGESVDTVVDEVKETGTGTGTNNGVPTNGSDPEATDVPVWGDLLYVRLIKVKNEPGMTISSVAADYHNQFLTTAGYDLATDGLKFYCDSIYTTKHYQSECVKFYRNNAKNNAKAMAIEDTYSDDWPTVKDNLMSLMYGTDVSPFNGDAAAFLDMFYFYISRDSSVCDINDYNDLANRIKETGEVNPADAEYFYLFAVSKGGIFGKVKAKAVIEMTTGDILKLTGDGAFSSIRSMVPPYNSSDKARKIAYKFDKLMPVTGQSSGYTALTALFDSGGNYGAHDDRRATFGSIAFKDPAGSGKEYFGRFLWGVGVSGDIPTTADYSFKLAAAYQDVRMDVANTDTTRSDFFITFSGDVNKVINNRYYAINFIYDKAPSYPVISGYEDATRRLNANKVSIMLCDGPTGCYEFDSYFETVKPSLADYLECGTGDWFSDKTTGRSSIVANSETFKKLLNGTYNFLYGFTVQTDNDCKTLNRMWHPLNLQITYKIFNTKEEAYNWDGSGGKFMTPIPEPSFFGYKQNGNTASNFNNWFDTDIIEISPEYRHIPWERHSTQNPGAYAEIVANQVGSGNTDWNVAQGIPSTENVSVAAGGTMYLWDFGGWVHIYGTPYGLTADQLAIANKDEGLDLRAQSQLVRQIRFDVDVVRWWGEENPPCNLTCKGHVVTDKGSHSWDTFCPVCNTKPHVDEPHCDGGPTHEECNVKGWGAKCSEHNWEGAKVIPAVPECPGYSVTLYCNDGTSVAGETKTLRANGQGWNISGSVTTPGGKSVSVDAVTVDLIDEGYTKGYGCSCDKQLNMIHPGGARYTFNVWETLDVYAWKEITAGQVYVLGSARIVDVDERVVDKSAVEQSRASSCSSGQVTVQRYLGFGTSEKMAGVITNVPAGYTDVATLMKSPAVMPARFTFTDFMDRRLIKTAMCTDGSNGIVDIKYQTMALAGNGASVHDYWMSDPYVLIQVAADHKASEGVIEVLDKCTVREDRGHSGKRWETAGLSSTDITYQTYGHTGDKMPFDDLELEALQVINAWQYAQNQHHPLFSLAVKSDAVTMDSHYSSKGFDLRFWDVVNALYVVDNGIQLFNYPFTKDCKEHFRSHQSAYSVEQLSRMVDADGFGFNLSDGNVVLGYNGRPSENDADKYGLFGYTRGTRDCQAMDYYGFNGNLSVLKGAYDAYKSGDAGMYDAALGYSWMQLLTNHPDSSLGLTDNPYLWHYEGSKFQSAVWAADGTIDKPAIADDSAKTFSYGCSVLGQPIYQAGSTWYFSMRSHRQDCDLDTCDSQHYYRPEVFEGYYSNKFYDSVVGSGGIVCIQTQSPITQHNIGTITDDGYDNMAIYKTPYVINNIPLVETADNGLYSDAITVNMEWQQATHFDNLSTEDGLAGWSSDLRDKGTESVLLHRDNGVSAYGVPTYTKKAAYSDSYVNRGGQRGVINDIVIHDPVSLEGWQLIGNNYGSYDNGSEDESGQDARFYYDENGNKITIDSEKDKPNYIVLGNSFHLWVSDFGDFRDATGNWNTGQASQSLGVGSTIAGADSNTGVRNPGAKGYTDNMITTPWVKARYVQFSFPVAYKKYDASGNLVTVAAAAYELIDLSNVPAIPRVSDADIADNKYRYSILKHSDGDSCAPYRPSVPGSIITLGDGYYNNNKKHYSNAASVSQHNGLFDTLFHAPTKALQDFWDNDRAFTYGLDYEFIALPSGEEDTAAFAQYYVKAVNETSEHSWGAHADNNAMRDLENLQAVNWITRRQEVELVGRIGNLAIEDVGDFRYSELFKQKIDGSWLIPGVIHNVDIWIPNGIIATQYDIYHNDTSGANPWANHAAGSLTNYYISDMIGLGKAGKWYPLPLTSMVNPVEEYKKEQLRMGYKVYLDVETIGNYYGINVDRKPDGAVTINRGSTGIHDCSPTFTDSREKVMTIIPKYYLYDGGDFYSIDMYYGNTGARTLFWSGNKDVKVESDLCAQYINLTEASSTELPRRNVSAAEIAENKKFYGAKLGQIVISAFDQEDYIGTTSKIVLDQFDNTYIGSPDMYGLYRTGTDGVTVRSPYNISRPWFTINSDAVFSIVGKIGDANNQLLYNQRGEQINDVDFFVQNQRWYFTMGLPSSTYITYADADPNVQSSIEESHDKLMEQHPNGVVICYLDIEVTGDVWNLEYKAPMMQDNDFDYPPVDPNDPNTPLPKSEPDNPIHVKDKNDNDTPETIDPDWQPTFVYDKELTSAQDWDTYGTH